MAIICETLVEMIESLTNRCIELEDTVELKEEIIETQRVIIGGFKEEAKTWQRRAQEAADGAARSHQEAERLQDAAETWQRRALEAADEVTLAHRETDKMRERRDHWLQMFLAERAEVVRIEAELSPPF